MPRKGAPEIRGEFEPVEKLLNYRSHSKTCQQILMRIEALLTRYAFMLTRLKIQNTFT